MRGKKKKKEEENVKLENVLQDSAESKRSLILWGFLSMVDIWSRFSSFCCQVN